MEARNQQQQGPRIFWNANGLVRNEDITNMMMRMEYILKHGKPYLERRSIENVWSAHQAFSNNRVVWSCKLDLDRLLSKLYTGKPVHSSIWKHQRHSIYCIGVKVKDMYKTVKRHLERKRKRPGMSGGREKTQSSSRAEAPAQVELPNVLEDEKAKREVDEDMDMIQKMAVLQTARMIELAVNCTHGISHKQMKLMKELKKACPNFRVRSAWRQRVCARVCNEIGKEEFESVELQHEVFLGCQKIVNDEIDHRNKIRADLAADVPQLYADSDSFEV